MQIPGFIFVQKVSQIHLKIYKLSKRLILSCADGWESYHIEYSLSGVKVDALSLYSLTNALINWLLSDFSAAKASASNSSYLDDIEKIGLSIKKKTGITVK